MGVTVTLVHHIAAQLCSSAHDSASCVGPPSKPENDVGSSRLAPRIGTKVVRCFSLFYRLIAAYEKSLLSVARSNYAWSCRRFRKTNSSAGDRTHGVHATFGRDAQDDSASCSQFVRVANRLENTPSSHWDGSDSCVRCERIWSSTENLQKQLLRHLLRKMGRA